jgi:predicted nucleic acid-binding protein
MLSSRRTRTPSSAPFSTASIVPAILVDASAFIAFLDRSDTNHDACVKALASISDPLVTVWPAVTEAMYLLSGSRNGQDALFDMIEDDGVALVSQDETDLARMKILMRKYRNLPMDLADAALVRLAERERLTRILTFDKHFAIYALPGRARFTLIGP